MEDISPLQNNLLIFCCGIYEFYVISWSILGEAFISNTRNLHNNYIVAVPFYFLDIRCPVSAAVVIYYYLGLASFDSYHPHLQT